ncbi:MAG: ethylbenzene dehydrogenase-related protein [Halomonas sp.]|uniref:ethylbenzene dehydrogenase-related protein n=1 Tax=Halomonas sp. TaxID=1486246 RepID=UPI003F91673A
MRLRHFFQTCTLATLALVFAATGALADHDERNPNVTEINPGDTVKVSRIPGTIYLRTQDDPDDLIWDRLPMYRTTLLPAPPVHQSVTLRFKNEVEEGKHLYFQVARSDDRFYIRMRWKDNSEDRASTVDSFRDGVAVQYALGDTDTSYMMGSGPENPVNIWYWRADHEQRVENLAAGGFGSTTLLPEQDVSGASAYITDEITQNNQWHVVMSRPFNVENPANKHEVDFDRDRVPMGFAVWQGSDAERDGNKRVTHTWILLDTGIDDSAAADDNAEAQADATADTDADTQG